MTDAQRLAWLEEDLDRLVDLKSYIVNECTDADGNFNICDAIDKLAKLQAQENAEAG